MRNKMLYKYVPYFIFKKLFGDRGQFGLAVVEDDHDYRKWKENYLEFYDDNQKGKIGSVVNRWGFSIAGEIDFREKDVLELGPGIIEHTCFFAAKPKTYSLADIDPLFLEKSAKVLEDRGFTGITTREVSADGVGIPMESGSVDVVLSFHQLEHVYELERHIDEIRRVLKPGGIFAGSVPTEGALAWGFGRFLTSRRYVKKNMSFNYDKIICWEHPNFVDKIAAILRRRFDMVKSVKKPFPFLPMDCNLSYSFICRRRAA